jgi:hypothetical protein
MTLLRRSKRLPKRRDWIFDDVLPIVHVRAIMNSMLGADFIRRVRKIANRCGVAVHFDAAMARAVMDSCTMVIALRP